jgi:hypothetical protein
VLKHFNQEVLRHTEWSGARGGWRGWGGVGGVGESSVDVTQVGHFRLAAEFVHSVCVGGVTLRDNGR